MYTFIPCIAILFDQIYMPGNTDSPIVYHVKNIRNGRTFCARTVKAVQSGETISVVMASYHRHQALPTEDQYTMPVVPPPKDVLSMEDWLRLAQESRKLSEQRWYHISQLVCEGVPIEVRPVDKDSFTWAKGIYKAKTYAWIRAKECLGEDSYTHHCAAAYLCDFLATAMISFPGMDTVMSAALDYSMWFHSFLRTDDWMLYECEYPRFGNPDLPILYHVEITRNGRSFCSRTVKAVQNGETILTMMASYQKLEATPIENQYTMPVVPAPEELISTEDWLKLALEKLSEKRRDYITKVLAEDIPIEVHPVDIKPFIRTKVVSEAKTCAWVRAKGYIGDDSYAHRCVAAYISDHFFLGTALIPFPRFRTAMAASLDHSMWFHSLFRIDEWMLYECESPRLVGGRALVLGRLWKRDGTLAVSVAQEGILRGKVHESSKMQSKL